MYGLLPFLPIFICHVWVDSAKYARINAIVSNGAAALAGYLTLIAHDREPPSVKMMTPTVVAAVTLDTSVCWPR